MPEPFGQPCRALRRQLLQLGRRSSLQRISGTEIDRAATTCPERFRTGAATQLTSGFDSLSSTATPRSRIPDSTPRNRTGSVTLLSVIARSGAPSGRRAASSPSGREASSILPTAVQCAGSRRPAAETMRTAWVESTLAT